MKNLKDIINKIIESTKNSFSGEYTLTKDEVLPYIDKNKGNKQKKAEQIVKPSPQAEVVKAALYQARNPNVKDFNISDTVKSAIDMAAKKYDIPASLLYDIALQESSFDPSKRNPQPGVTASGLFQFNDPTWETIQNYDRNPKNSIELTNNNRMDPNTSAMAAAYLIKHGQLGRWDASKGVWGQYYKPEELKSYYSQTK